MKDEWLVDPESWTIFEELSKLPFDTHTLDLTKYGQNLKPEHIIYISRAPNFSLVNTINVERTSFSWNDLVTLWNSSIFGCRYTGELYYEKKSNKAVRQIKIKIDGSTFEKQIFDLMRDKKNIYGLLAHRKKFGLTHYRDFIPDAIKIFNIYINSELIDENWIKSHMKST